MTGIEKYLEQWEKLAGSIGCEPRFTAPLGDNITLYHPDLDTGVSFRPEDIENADMVLQRIRTSFSKDPQIGKKLAA